MISVFPNTASCFLLIRAFEIGIFDQIVQHAAVEDYRKLRMLRSEIMIFRIFRKLQYDQMFLSGHIVSYKAALGNGKSILNWKAARKYGAAETEKWALLKRQGKNGVDRDFAAQ